MRQVKHLVVHCSDTPNHREHTAADIHRWHKENDWSGIGYHAVIQRNGTLEMGRPQYWTGAHVRGHNSTALGVCLIGRDEYTPAQYRTLEGLITTWSLDHPAVDVVGHRDLDSGKTCPNFDVSSWWTGVKNQSID